MKKSEVSLPDLDWEKWSNLAMYYYHSDSPHHDKQKANECWAISDRIKTLMNDINQLTKEI
jgi:hypothetical protein